MFFYLFYIIGVFAKYIFLSDFEFWLYKCQSISKFKHYFHMQKQKKKFFSNKKTGKNFRLEINFKVIR